MNVLSSDAAATFELRFPSLHGHDPEARFPCDAAGRVDPRRLSDQALCDYAYARSAVGREFDCPRICPRGAC